jgi:hypothetical protein
MGLAMTELAIPSLEDLYRMTTVPDQRVVIRDVDWSLPRLTSLPQRSTGRESMRPCAFRSSGDSTEKVSRSSSSGWRTTVRITPSTKAGSCRSAPKKSGAGLLTKTPTMSRPGLSDSARGSRPSWCRDGLGDHPDSACITYSSRE